MSELKNGPDIPTPEAFRRWLVGALDLLELRPATVSAAIGPSVNSVGQFLRDTRRDMTLSKAAMIERHVRDIAADRGVELPLVITRIAAVSDGAA